jgi:hypothetical protein
MLTRWPKKKRPAVEVTGRAKRWQASAETRLKLDGCPDEAESHAGGVPTPGVTTPDAVMLAPGNAGTTGGLGDGAGFAGHSHTVPLRHSPAGRDALAGQHGKRFSNAKSPHMRAPDTLTARMTKIYPGCNTFVNALFQKVSIRSTTPCLKKSHSKRASAISSSLRRWFFILCEARW